MERINTLISLSSFLLVTCSHLPLARPNRSEKVYLEAVACSPEPKTPLKDLSGVQFPGAAGAPAKYLHLHPFPEGSHWVVEVTSAGDAWELYVLCH